MCTFGEMKLNVVSQHLEPFLKTQVSHDQLYFTGSYCSHFFRKYYYLISRFYLRKRLNLQRVLTCRFLL